MRNFALTFALLLSAVALADDPSCPPNYGYSGYMPPSQWTYVTKWKCGASVPMQSPIDVTQPSSTQQNKPITVRYVAMPLTVRNSGHDYRVIPTRANSISVGNVNATLGEFHFHVPAEHKINSEAFDAEIHFVHVDTSTTPNKIYVIAVLLRRRSAANPALQPIIDQLPLNLCASKDSTTNFAPLLTSPIKSYYRYVGSLTTPACDGDVTFFVIPTSMPIGDQQLAALRRFGDNARTPLQPRNGRAIIRVVP
jgi:carbonic anhydrase